MCISISDVLRIGSLVFLMQLEIFIIGTEGYTISTADEYTFGDVMKFIATYEAKYNKKHIVRLMHGNKLLHKCTILPERQKRVLRNHDGVIVKNSVEVYYQIFHIPTDFFYFQYHDVTPLDLLMIMATSRVGSGVVKESVNFHVTNTSLSMDLFNTSVDIYSNSIFKGKATHFLEDPELPKVSRKTKITMEVSNATSKYTYRMELYRMSASSPNLCLVDTLPAKINLEEFNSLESLMPCQLSMTTSSLSVGAFMMPFGLIRVSVYIKDKLEGSEFVLHRYFKVEADGITSSKVPFHIYTSPNADEFTYPPGKDLHISTSKSFFPFSLPSFGHNQMDESIIIGRARRMREGHRTVPWFDSNCGGVPQLCKDLPDNRKPDVTLSGKKVESVLQTRSNINLVFVFWWLFKFHNDGTEYQKRMEKYVRIFKSALAVDIICVRNCRHRYIPTIPGIFRAECHNCEHADPQDLSYVWTFQNVTEVEGERSKYLTILKPAQLEFTVNVTVTHRPTVFNINETTEGPRHGYAIKRFRSAQTDRWLWVDNSVQASKEATLFDTFDIVVEANPPSDTELAAPIHSYFRTTETELHRRVEMCTFTTPLRKVALYLPETGRLRATVGLQTADGRTYEQQIQLPKKDPDLDVVTGTLEKKCSVATHGALGLSGLLALAQEIHTQLYTDEEIMECYDKIKGYVTGKDIPPARYKVAYWIQYMFFMAHRGLHTLGHTYEALKNMDLTKRLLFEETMQTTEELELFTKYSFAVTRRVLNKPPKLAYKQHSLLDQNLLQRMQNASMDLLDLYEKRDTLIKFKYATRAVHMWWTEIRPGNYTIGMKLTTRRFVVSIRVPSQVFLHSLALHRPNGTKIVRTDNFVNIMITIMDSTLAKRPGQELSYGSVGIYVQTKTSRQRLPLVANYAPILVQFQRFRMREEILSMHMDIEEEDHEVKDCTCVVFSIGRSDLVNMTLSVDITGPYNYSFTSIDAKYPSESIRLTEAPLKNIGHHFSFFMPTVSSVYKYKYPLSRYIFLIRLPTKSGNEFGPRDSKVTEKKRPGRLVDQATKPRVGAVGGVDDNVRTMLDNGISGLVDAATNGSLYQRRLPSPKAKPKPKRKVRRRVQIKIQIMETHCYFYRKGWVSSNLCQFIPDKNISLVKCQCYVDAMYSALRISAQQHLIYFTPNALDYHGPTMIPATFVILWIALFLFYCYWSFFQDIREKDCAHTHVIRNMYNPNSVEQYLVCISTGGMPGSGTDARVGFLLIGESGSLKFVMPEGNFCYYTGTELWFLVSSDMELGHITGVTINYDKYVSGSNLYPWLLKGVVVYNKLYNHVITFRANQMLGLHMPSLVLPTVPHKYEWGGEMMVRFWRIMKWYHILGSVVFHMPGRGATRCQSALASLSVIIASSALAIEIRGPPTPVYHLNVLRAMSSQEYARSILTLSAFTCCMSLLFKLLYSIVFQKKLGVIWYNKPQPIEGYWQGGMPSHSWLDMVTHGGVPTIPRTSTSTWITNKKPVEKKQRPHYNTPVQSRTQLKDASGTDSESEQSDIVLQLSRPPMSRLTLRNNEMQGATTFSSHTLTKAKGGTFHVSDPGGSTMGKKNFIEQIVEWASDMVGLKKEGSKESTVKSVESGGSVTPTDTIATTDSTTEVSVSKDELSSSRIGLSGTDKTAASRTDSQARGLTADITVSSSENSSPGLGARSPLPDTAKKSPSGMVRASSETDAKGLTAKSSGKKGAKADKHPNATRSADKNIGKHGIEGSSKTDARNITVFGSGSARSVTQRGLTPSTGSNVSSKSSKEDRNINRIDSDKEKTDQEFKRDALHDGRTSPTPHQSTISLSVAQPTHDSITGNRPLCEYIQPQKFKPPVNRIDLCGPSQSSHEDYTQIPAGIKEYEPLDMCIDSRYEPKTLEDDAMTADIPSFINSSFSESLEELVYDASDEDSSVVFDPSVKTVIKITKDLFLQKSREANVQNVPKLLKRRKPMLGESSSKPSSDLSLAQSDNHGQTRCGRTRHQRYANLSRHTSRTTVSGVTQPLTSKTSGASSQSSCKKDTSAPLRRRDTPKPHCQGQAPQPVSKPRRGMTNKAVLNITSFRQFYFRPVLTKGLTKSQWRLASQAHTNFRFLRGSRYLDKMSREYDLSDVVYPCAEIECYASSSSARGGAKFSSPHTEDSSSEETTELDSRDAVDDREESCADASSQHGLLTSTTTSTSSLCRNRRSQADLRRHCISTNNYSRRHGVTVEQRIRPPRGFHNAANTKLTSLADSLAQRVERQPSLLRSRRVPCPCVWIGQSCIFSDDGSESLMLNESISPVASASHGSLIPGVCHREPSQSRYHDRQLVGTHLSDWGDQRFLVEHNIVAEDSETLDFSAESIRGITVADDGRATLADNKEYIWRQLKNLEAANKSNCLLARDSPSVTYEHSQSVSKPARGVLAKLKHMAMTIFSHRGTRDERHGQETPFTATHEGEIPKSGRAETVRGNHEKAVGPSRAMRTKTDKDASRVLTATGASSSSSHSHVDSPKVDKNRSAKATVATEGPKPKPAKSQNSGHSQKSGAASDIKLPTKTKSEPKGGINKKASSLSSTSKKDATGGPATKSAMSVDAAAKKSTTSTADGPATKSLPVLNKVPVKGKASATDPVKIETPSASVGQKKGKPSTEAVKRGQSKVSSVDPKKKKKQKNRLPKEWLLPPMTWADTQRHNRPHCCVRCCHRICDFFRAIWAIKSYVVKIPLIAVTICAIIFSSGWVCVNGLYYSLQEGVEWLLVVVAAIVLEVVVLEPLVFLCCAVVSSSLWRTPSIIYECLKRFSAVNDELDHREWMVELSLAGRHITSFIHHQAAPESASLFHLHDKIYKALTRVTLLPHVTFHTGVYWLIFYTICTLLLVNMQADTYNSFVQNEHIDNMLGLNLGEEQVTTVEGMWDFVEKRLRPALLEVRDNINITSLSTPLTNTSDSSLGTLLLTPVRFKQIRVKPFKTDGECSPLPGVKISRIRQCNYDLTSENTDTRDFGDSWRDVWLKRQNRYTYRTEETSIFDVIDFHHKSGYIAVLNFDEADTGDKIQEIRGSDWVDEHTRFIIIDFSLINQNAHIISSFRVTFEFKRAAPFWYVRSFAFHFEKEGNQVYYMAVIGVFFVVISAYNIIKELLLLYKMGLVEYFTRFTSFIEMFKVVLSVLLCYFYLQKRGTTQNLMQSLRYQYLFREDPQYVDFFEMAAMDFGYRAVGGFLAFTCIFQMFDMLSKIRRLLVFIKLLINAVTLFFMPLMTGMAFAFLSNILFGATNENFSNLGYSYLMINQYFIKPRPIYDALTDNNPFLGPWFVFTLGFAISFFVVNFFIAFLNEAYSSILSQVRIGTYKVREKTRLEYVYEFLGIESTISWDVEEDLILQDRAKDKDFLAAIKRLIAS